MERPKSRFRVGSTRTTPWCSGPRTHGTGRRRPVTQTPRQTKTGQRPYPDVTGGPSGVPHVHSSQPLPSKPVLPVTRRGHAVAHTDRAKPTTDGLVTDTTGHAEGQEPCRNTLRVRRDSYPWGPGLHAGLVPLGPRPPHCTQRSRAGVEVCTVVEGAQTVKNPFSEGIFDMSVFFLLLFPNTVLGTPPV